jgi:hypothetical protein
MKTPEYKPGLGYTHGYEARNEGKEMPSSFESGPYWDEYRAGWFDAHRVILETARREYDINKNKLQENDERREFLQD